MEDYTKQYITWLRAKYVSMFLITIELDIVIAHVCTLFVIAFFVSHLIKDYMV